MGYSNVWPSQLYGPDERAKRCRVLHFFGIMADSLGESRSASIVTLAIGGNDLLGAYWS